MQGTSTNSEVPVYKYLPYNCNSYCHIQMAEADYNQFLLWLADME